nr:uncharacterized protein LOC109184184 [Ipomoea trifida]
MKDTPYQELQRYGVQVIAFLQLLSVAFLYLHPEQGTAMKPYLYMLQVIWNICMLHVLDTFSSIKFRSAFQKWLLKAFRLLGGLGRSGLLARQIGSGGACSGRAGGVQIVHVSGGGVVIDVGEEVDVLVAVLVSVERAGDGLRLGLLHRRRARPKKSRSLDDAAVKISAEEYEYEIFRSPEEYKRANLEPPRYDLPQKYTPQKAAVTVAVRPPLPQIGSQGAMRSFPVSARPPAPAKKISLGSKTAESARSADPSIEAPSAEALVPAGLPLTATHASDPSGGHGEARAARHGKEKEKEKAVDVEEVAPAKRAHRAGSGSTTPVIDVLMKHGDEPPAALLSRICAAAPPPEKTSGWSTALVGERIACDLIQMAHSVTDLFARAKDGDEIHRREVAPLKKSLAKRDLRIKELEGKLKTAEETGRRILERADLGEKILTDPVLLARHICRGREAGEAVLAAISRTPVGEDLMYEFGTWAFNSGRRAMQNDVKTALEVSMEETDLPKVLAVLPEEVPDPGPTPFTSVPEGSNLPVPIVEVSAGPSAEAATTTGPATEVGAEGDGEPRADPATETS